MLGILEEGRLRLWRRIGGRLVPWREIHGDDGRLLRALSAARELDALAGDVGGWTEAFRLSLDPLEPRNPRKVVARVLPKDSLDRSLRKL
jgi:hypothetical protein